MREEFEQMKQTMWKEHQQSMQRMGQQNQMYASLQGDINKVEDKIKSINSSLNNIASPRSKKGSQKGGMAASKRGRNE